MIKVKLFASFREIAKSDYIELELNGKPTYGDIVRGIAIRLGVDPQEIKLLVNDEPAKLDAGIEDYQKIIAFPPVAGG
ncbi:MAG: MoaD/ThiS family protein [Thaumarchaeota archaeon]|nr:MoaD/ThiS family protein [Nitrososphaerota archaeon]